VAAEVQNTTPRLTIAVSETTSLAARERVWYTSAVPRTRPLRIGAVALPLALVTVLSFALPAGNPIAPIAPVGEVQGAVAEPTAAPEASHPPDPRLAYARATDRDGPRAGRDALPAQPGELIGYTWPLRKGRISLPFKAIPGGSRIKDGKLFHDGVDIASFCGDTVRAAHGGVVLAAGRHFDDYIGWIGDLSEYYRTLDRKKLWDDLPNVVIIDDGNGYRSVYAHMSVVSVAVGQRVKGGQKIGKEGATGHASGCHVHFGLFSPLETDTFGVRANIRKALNTPEFEIARIDPLQVLPGGAEALKTRKVPQPPVPTAAPEVLPATGP
jgi:murein DD-endopeptidase MepM/ murein hydrolase activator NlpD